MDLARAGHVYVATKLAAELLVHSYREMYGQHFTILRYGIPYGPRMRDALVVARFVPRRAGGDADHHRGHGEQQRNYVFVGDIADAHVRALSPAAADQVLALEGGTPVSVREIADTVTGAHPAGADRARARPHRRLPGVGVSNRRAKEVLDWSPQTSFRGRRPPLPRLAHHGRRGNAGGAADRGARGTRERLMRRALLLSWLAGSRARGSCPDVRILAGRARLVHRGSGCDAAARPARRVRG